MLATESDELAFAWPGQTLAFYIPAELPRAKDKVASIEPSVEVNPTVGYAEFEPIEPVTSRKITKEFESFRTRFTIENPGDTALSSVPVGMACYDKSGTLVGGDSNFVDVPAGGRASVELLSLDVTKKPASCTAYPAPREYAD